MPQIEEKARLLEFAAIQAATETNCPVLAPALHLYRVSNRLTTEQLINWLGLSSKDDFYRLALCLKPGRQFSPLDWRDYTFNIKDTFPTLNFKRLRLIVETEAEQR